jgi:hypothetical protein
MVATGESIMPAPAVCASWGLALTLLLSSPALADRTAVQDVPCESGRTLHADDGTVLACRLATAADLLVAPTAGNAKVACSAGSDVEFHRNGYLAFCDSAGAAASYLTRGRSATRCRSGARLAFDDNGYLEYCS